MIILDSNTEEQLIQVSKCSFGSWWAPCAVAWGEVEQVWDSVTKIKWTTKQKKQKIHISSHLGCYCENYL